MPQAGSFADEVAAALGNIPGVEIVRDAGFGAKTTYRVGGRCQALVNCGRIQSLGDVLDLARAVPVYVLGNGSNTLVSDRGWAGMVLKLVGEFEELEVLSGRVRMGSAVSLPVAVRQLAGAGIGGLEWAVGIPGTVGGAVKMNAGGHGSDTASWIVSAEVWRPAGEKYRLESLGAQDLGLRYRGSDIGELDVVASATFRTMDASGDEPKRAISEIVKWRREHQPGGQNAGSVFVNPKGDNAARLIESLGLKGFRHLSAMVSPVHANFIQSTPGGSGDDVFELIWMVQQRVEKELGIRMRTEIKLLGFDPERSAYLRGE